MGTTIGNTASDVYASMSNSAFARGVTLPVGWSKIRIGARIRLTDLGSGPSGTPKFAMGLCSGTTNILGDATTTHFVGVVTNSASWNYFTSSAAVYFGFSIYPYKKVNTTETIGGVAIASDCRFPIYIPSGGQNYRYFYFAEITKGSPNYTFNIFIMVGNNPPTDYTEAQFKGLMAGTTLVLSPYSYGTPQTLAVDEGTDGTLNAVNFWWNRSDFSYEIHDVGVGIIA